MSTLQALLIAGGICLALVIGGCVFVAVVGNAFKPARSTAPTVDTADTDGLGAPAPAAPVEETPDTVIVALGQTLEFTSGTDEIHYTLTAGPPVTRTEFGTKPDKGQFYALSATIEAKVGTAYACSCDFALVAADGTAYEPDATYSVKGGFEAVQINTGQKKSGLVVWDIPAGAQARAKIELRASWFLAGDQGFWQLP